MTVRKQGKKVFSDFVINVSYHCQNQMENEKKMKESESFFLPAVRPLINSEFIVGRVGMKRSVDWHSQAKHYYPELRVILSCVSKRA